jgi:hypothetical protein
MGGLDTAMIFRQAYGAATAALDVLCIVDTLESPCQSARSWLTVKITDSWTAACTAACRRSGSPQHLRSVTRCPTAAHEKTHKDTDNFSCHGMANP